MALPRLSRVILWLAAGCSTTAAHACTVCDSPTAHHVRAGIFNGHFLHTLLLVAAPFPIFAAMVMLLHFGMPDLDEPESSAAEPIAAGPGTAAPGTAPIRIGASGAELSA